MKFLIIDGHLLENPSFSPADKMILSFMHGLEKGGKYFYGGDYYLAQEFGCQQAFIKKRFDILYNLGIIEADENQIRLAKTWDYICNYKTEKNLDMAINEIAKAIGQSKSFS